MRSFLRANETSVPANKRRQPSTPYTIAAFDQSDSDKLLSLQSHGNSCIVPDGPHSMHSSDVDSVLSPRTGRISKPLELARMANEW